MSNDQTHRDKNPARERFYNRICHHIDELSLPEQTHGIFRNPIRIQNFSHKLYGELTQDEMQKIMASYEMQDKSADRNNQPVICDGVKGKSFAKLLHSKLGFHHLGSTSYLVEHLGIKDSDRDSYLYGHSSYSIKPEETLEGLRNCETNVLISHIVNSARILFERRDYLGADNEINRALKLDDKNTDAIVMKARCCSLRKDYGKAIENFLKAIRYGASRDELSVDLAESLFQSGMPFFHQADYKSALEIFDTALKYNKDHEGVKLHREMIQKKMSGSFSQQTGAGSYRS